MSAIGTSGTIIASMVVMVGSSLVVEAAEGQVTMGPIVFGFMLGSALMLIGFVSGPLAKMLAIMGVVGTLVTRGSDLTKILGGIRGA
jgi:hypothetical protein